MKKLNVALCVSLLAVSANAFAVRDFSMRIPFADVTLQPYDIVTAYRIKDQYNGRNIQCTIKDLVANHTTKNIMIISANYVGNINDSHDGGYQLVETIPAIYFKFDIKPVDSNYNSYIRIGYLFNNTDPDPLKVSCIYQ